MKRCLKCREYKQEQAYVGARSVCRNCWLALTKEEKEGFILCRKQMERAQSLAFEKLNRYKSYTDQDED
jgi:hypothetical protein